MKYKIICEDCNSDNFEFYQEQNITYRSKINKNRTVSKRKRKCETDDNCPWGLQCLECGTLYDYNTDDKERIISISKK